MKLKKGDNVIVIAGKDKGRSGKISTALPARDRVVIEGVNLRKRHRRPTKQGQKGQIVDMPAPIHISNVMLYNADTKKRTRKVTRK